MNLKELQAFQEQLAQQGTLRADRGQTHYETGLALLESYNQQPNKDTLLQAMHTFIQCMVQQRNRIEPLIILSYIYYALNSPQLAAKYYRLAASINSEHQDLVRLRDILTSNQKAPTFASAKISRKNRPQRSLESFTEIDLDTLYEETLIAIEEKINEVMWTQLNWEIVLEVSRFEALKLAETDFAHSLAGIDDQIQRLSKEFDVHPLILKLRPLEIRLKQYQQLVVFSQEGTLIQQDIYRLEKKVQQAIDNVSISKTDLDLLLDHCDTVADKIDAFEPSRINTKALISDYHRMIKQVDYLQDLLEDH